MTILSIPPTEARRLINTGAKLIDIRDRDEYMREHIAEAVNVPMVEIDGLETDDRPVIFHCRSGARTQANASRLAGVADAPCYIIEGGLDAWRRAGMKVVCDRGQPLELMRQVQLCAGGLTLLGAVLGFIVDPRFFVLPAIVGAGMMVAGATGWCGMARLLRHMPWNRRMTA
jgi:rhodanese-related sulfurtransferase